VPEVTGRWLLAGGLCWDAVRVGAAALGRLGSAALAVLDAAEFYARDDEFLIFAIIAKFDVTPIGKRKTGNSFLIAKP